MSEQIPAEFAWIKPGAKCLHKNWEGIKTITREPYKHSAWGWCTQIEERGMFQFCSDLMPIPNDSSITLTLTREQAKRFIADVDCLMPMGFYGAHPEIGKLKKQIEEKLK